MLIKSGKYLEDEVKRKVPLSYESGNPRSEILQEYELIASRDVKCLEKKMISGSLNGEEFINSRRLG